MAELRLARIASYVAPDDQYAQYFREALDHAGLLHQPAHDSTLENLEDFDVLLLCGKGSLTSAQLEEIRVWHSRGNAIVCAGGTFGLTQELGIEECESGVHLSSSYLSPCDDSGTLWPENAPQTRFFGGVVASAAGAKVFAKTEGGFVGAAVRDRAFFIAPHIGQTIAMLQLGRSVETDCVGPNDGSAVLDDGVLRSEDGTILSFEHDRSCKDSDTPIFEVPYADIVKELWLRAILQACASTGKAPALLWHWPDNAVGVGTFSIECEEFSSDNMSSLLRQLMMIGAPAAWLVGLPGYPLDVYRSLLKSGHEVGLLFLTDDSAGWTEERLRVQQLAMMRSASLGAIVSARPLAGRWKGLKTFYDLAESTGVKLSLSKGGRQPGTTGFLFGTCHLFFPQRKDGTPYRVAELPYSAHLPGLAAPHESLGPLIDTVGSRYGCFHVGLRSDYVQSETAVSCLRTLFAAARQNHFAFLTPEQIYDFERSRRTIKHKAWVDGDRCFLSLIPGASIEDLSLLVAGAGLDATASGQRVRTTTLRRYGMDFLSVTLNLEAKTQVELCITSATPESAAA